MITLCIRVVAVCLLACTSLVRADDVFVHVPLTQLEFSNGSLPVQEPSADSWRRAEVLIPYAALDGPGEAYIAESSSRDEMRWQTPRYTRESAVLVAKLPSVQAITGTV